MGGREGGAVVDRPGGGSGLRSPAGPPGDAVGGAAKEVAGRGGPGAEGRGPASPPPGSAPLLAQAGDGAGERDRDRRLEVADIDSQLERARRDDAQQVALREPPLEIAPLLRRVPGAVGSDPPLALGVVEARLGELV